MFKFNGESCLVDIWSEIEIFNVEKMQRIESKELITNERDIEMINLPPHQFE
jgi:hypothetical protein